MNNIYEYYDSMADISVSTKEAIKSLALARESVQKALCAIKSLRQHGDTTISFVSNVTTDDVHRNLLFLELLLNQTFGVTDTVILHELLELTSYLTNEEDS